MKYPHSALLKVLEDCEAVIISAISDAEYHRAANHGGTGNLTPLRNTLTKVRAAIAQAKGETR